MYAKKVWERALKRELGPTLTWLLAEMESARFQSESRDFFLLFGERLLLVGDSDGDNHIEISVGHRDGSLIGEAHHPLTLPYPNHGHH